MSRPKVLQRLGALGGLQLGDAEAPEDVKSTQFIIQLFEDAVKAIAEDIGSQPVTRIFGCLMVRLSHKVRCICIYAIGIAGHGFAGDLWHYKNSAYIPDWYAVSCVLVDLALGAYVATRIPAYREV